MPAPSSAPTPGHNSKKQRAIPQNSAHETLANIGLAELCASSSSQPAKMAAPNMAALADREWTDSELFYNLTVNIHARLIPQGNEQPDFTLKGLQPTEIGALGTLASTYKNADFIQTTATQSAGDILITLNQTRRGNPQSPPPRTATRRRHPVTMAKPRQRAQRKAFGLPADRPAGE